MSENSLAFYIFQFLPITAVEAVVLWRLKWSGAKGSILDALMINFASFVGLLLGLGPYIASCGPWGLTLFGTYSFLVEGGILMLLERGHAAKKLWITAFIANLCSCLLLGVETVFAAWHTHP